MANEMMDLLETAWGVIANAGGGDWTKESRDWQEAAAKWRDRWHDLLRQTRAPPETPHRATIGDCISVSPEDPPSGLPATLPTSPGAEGAPFLGSPLIKS